MFDKKCLRLGLCTMACAAVVSFLPGLYLFFQYGIIPTASEMGSIVSMLIASFLVGWIVQPLTFYPAMGVGASCLSWTTGNVADLRMPAISAGQKAAGIEAGTPEGNVISTMSAAVSNFVTVAVLTLVTFVGSGLISALPAAVTADFSYITPAIFGAIIMDYAMKNVKYNLPLIIAGVVFFLLFKALGLSSVWITLFVVITGMFVSRIMFTYWKKKDSAKAS